MNIICEPHTCKKFIRRCKRILNELSKIIDFDYKNLNLVIFNDLEDSDIFGEYFSAANTIRIPENKITSLDLLITVLSHEIVHANQSFLGKLILDSADGIYWRDEKYSSQHIYYKTAGASFEEYENWPWEIEARRMEKVLLDMIKPILHTTNSLPPIAFIPTK